MLDAHCVNHFEAPASATCARCGSFLCGACIAGSAPPRCAKCLALRWGVLSSEPYSFGLVLREGLGLCQRFIVLLLGLAAANAAVGFTVRRFVGGSVGQWAEIIIAGLFSTFTLGFWLLTLRDDLESVTRTPGERAAVALARLVRLAWARVRYSLLITLGMVFFIIPGFMLAGTFLFVEQTAMFTEGEIFAPTSALTTGRVRQLALLAFLFVVLQAAAGLANTGAQGLLIRQGIDPTLPRVGWELAASLYSFMSDAVLTCAYFSIAAHPVPTAVTTASPASPAP